ncbi:hypothetical protein C8R45DRAFT_1013148 [Mycena sanguinolenta]|nr:hypothetical protein C8R45DRAFT_1013148 [Mycena sanguinolenta]
MDLSTKDDPVFPPEIEQEIFRTTAVLYPKMVPTLLRVARRVHVWIEQLLYKTLHISSLQAKGASEEALLYALDRKPPDFLKTIRRLSIMTFNFNHTGMP